MFPLPFNKRIGDLMPLQNTDPSVTVYRPESLSNEEYHGDTTHLSSSALKTLLISPAAYKEKYIDGFSSGSSDAMDLGSYVHALILEPHLVDTEFAVFPGKVRRGVAWEEFKAANKDKTIITSSQVAKANEMLEGYSNSDHAKKLIADNTGVPELSMFSEIDGVPVKIRTDFFTTNGDIVDVKTTNAPLSEADIQSVIRKYSYDLSAALYVDVAKQYDGKDHDFYFVFLSKQSGAPCRAFKASKKLLELGRKKYREALALYSHCKAHGFETNGEPEEIPIICLPEASP